MSNETQSTVTTTVQPEVITKSDQSSEIASLVSLVKTNIEAQTALTKQVTDLASTIASIKKENPVAVGLTVENAPKVSDPVDVGDPVTIGNVYAGVNAEQASIAPAKSSVGTDSSGLSMEKTSDKKEEEKEEAKEVAKSGEYKWEVVKAIRPEIFNKTADEIPNGYQIIKAVEKGYGGKYTNAQDVLTHTLEKMFAGDFERLPVGRY